jgi:hypothetical protein
MVQVRLSLSNQDVDLAKVFDCFVDEMSAHRFLCHIADDNEDLLRLTTSFDNELFSFLK